MTSHDLRIIEDLLATGGDFGNPERLALIELLADWKEKRAQFIRAFLNQDGIDKLRELEDAVGEVVRGIAVHSNNHDSSWSCCKTFVIQRLQKALQAWKLK